MELEGSLSFSQETATGPYPDPELLAPAQPQIWKLPLVGCQ